MRKVIDILGITDILKDFQEGVDFTVESKEKIIFHSEKLVNCLIKQLAVEEFFKAVKELIPSALCSYHEEGEGERRKCVFTFKSKNSCVPQKKDRDLTYHGVNDQGGNVISGKFKNPEIEKQKNELIEENIKSDKKQVEKSEKNLTRHFIDSGNGLTYSTERKDKDKIIQETYHESRNKEEKNKKQVQQNDEALTKQGEKEGKSKTNQQNSLSSPLKDNPPNGKNS
jgi:hypothetical protein